MYSFKYNQQDATLYNILHCCQCSTCFRRFLRPSSGVKKLYAQHRACANLKLACCCVYSFWAPDDGRRNRLKHVEHWQQWRILYNVASCWLYLKEYIKDERSHERQRSNVIRGILEVTGMVYTVESKVANICTVPFNIKTDLHFSFTAYLWVTYGVKKKGQAFL